MVENDGKNEDGNPKDPWGFLPFEQRLIVWQRQLEQSRIEADHSIEGFRAVVSFATIAIRGLLIINGGAAIALLAFLGHIASSPTSAALVPVLSGALMYFGWGAFLAAFAAGGAYLAQVLFTELEGEKSVIWGNVCRVISVAVVATGYVVFILGLYKAKWAFAAFVVNG